MFPTSHDYNFSSVLESGALRKLSLALLVGVAMLSTGISLASDWEEERPLPDQGGMPPMAPPRNMQTSTVRIPGTPAGKMLQGGATKQHQLDSEPMPLTISTLQANVARREGQLSRIDGGAEAFLNNAPVNVPTPPAVFRAWIDKTHPQFTLSAERNQPGRVLNVKGQWDDSTKPMRSLGIRHQSIKEKELRTAPLEGVRVIVINCAGELPREALQRIRDFVGRGGYLITTDWALENTTARAFPGFIGYGGQKTGNAITDAYVLDPDPVLFNGVPVRRSTWKLDRGSQQIKILNPQRVRVLVRSSRLGAGDINLMVYPDRSYAGALATLFSFGRGKVLHIISHYDNNADSFRANTLPDPVPEIGISLRQALITNFIVEALSNSPPPEREPEQ